jgi:hypothetical protein
MGAETPEPSSHPEIAAATSTDLQATALLLISSAWPQDTGPPSRDIHI